MKVFTTTWTFIFFIYSGMLFGQNHADGGWKAFLKNDRSLAKKEFTTALQNPAEKESALLGLMLMGSNAPYLGDPFVWLKQFATEAKNPEPYLHAVWYTGILNSEVPDIRQQTIHFLQDLASKRGEDGALKAMACSSLGKMYAEAKMNEQAVGAFSQIGALENWTITGEFENISSSGFDKQYEVLKKPASGASFINKSGAVVKWFVPPYTRKDKWFDFTYYFNYRNSIVFAQTFVKSPINQEVQLRAGVSGSMKVWVNDALVIAEAEERNNDLDSYIRKIKLHAGYNRILVQVGESYAGRANFLIRMTDAAGNSVPGLSTTASTQEYVAAREVSGEPVELAHEKFFLDKIKAGVEEPVSDLLLANIYLQSDKLFEARQVLDKLKKQYPVSTYVNTLFLDLFSRSNNRTGLESVQEAIKMNDPAHPYALNFFYNNALEKQDYKKAEEYTDKLEALFGKDDPSVLLKRITLAGKNKNQAEMVRLAEYGYSKYPKNRSFVEYKYLIESSLRKNNKAAIEILKAYLKENDDYGFSKALAGLYFDAGNTEAGIKVYQSEIANDPVGVGIYTSQGKIYNQLQNYVKAEECLRKALLIAPYEASYHTDLATLLKSQGKKDEAVAEYRAALELSPNSYLAMRELRKLENKKDVFDYFKSFDVDSVVKKAPAASAYPDDNALILHENTDVVIYEGGGSEERHRMVAKVLNSAGLESWKEYTAPVKNWQTYIIEEAEVIKANGSKVPAEVNQTQAVFTNLEVGDCIFVQYKLFNYSQGQLANKFWDSFYFSHGYPYLRTEYNVLAARNQKVYYKFSQEDIAPQKTDVDEFVLYSWVRQNQPSLKYEDKMPALDDVANVLNVTTIPNWAYISNWYNDWASAKARPAYEVKEAVNTILEDQEKITDTQKAEKIYDYITKNITYSSVSFRQSGLIPQNPSAVLNTRIGDCKDVSTLFLSMAKEAGINAELVLVNTKDVGVKGILLPSIDFNHCIIKINTDGKERYLELTSNYLPFSSIGGSEINSAILDIDGSPDSKAIKLLNPATRKQNNISRITDVTMKETDLVVTDNNYRVAAMAGYMREAYLNLSERDRMKTMQETLGKTFPGAQLVTLTFRNLANTSARDTLYSSMNYLLKDEVKKVGGLSIVSLPWTDKAVAADFTISLPRHFPLDLAQLFSFDSESEVMAVHLPVGKKIVEGVAPLNLSSEFMDYSVAVQQKGSVITLKRTLTLKQTMVPASKVPDFHAFYKKIISADNKQLAFR